MAFDIRLTFSILFDCIKSGVESRGEVCVYFAQLINYKKATSKLNKSNGRETEGLCPLQKAYVSSLITSNY